MKQILNLLLPQSMRSLAGLKDFLWIGVVGLGGLAVYGLLQVVAADVLFKLVVGGVLAVLALEVVLIVRALARPEARDGFLRSFREYRAARRGEELKAQADEPAPGERG